MGRAEAARLEEERPRTRASLTLGKYQLLAVLGRGGMAEVFLALSRGAMGFDKLAVVKRLRDGMADDETFRAMFLDEARLAARLNHPNVVHTYEVGEHDGVYFIAMEYLEGQSLNKIVREAEKRGTPLEPQVSARIISDALAGLHHAHTLKDFDGRPLNIIHRDVSPQNLIVTYEGTTKLVDFGIAKAALSSNETEVGVVKGKVSYMSPEQARGDVLDARSDVFAMGIVLWEMLTQRRLMTGDSAASTLHRLLTAPVPAASSFRGDVGTSLDSIVERALQKDPDLRFPSALAMREALEAYLAGQAKQVRSDDIGQRVGGMFADIREAITKQIQAHVEGAGREPMAAPDAELSTGSAARRSAELPVLNIEGASSSGVVGSSGTAVSQQGAGISRDAVRASARPVPVTIVEVAAPPTPLSSGGTLAPAPAAPAKSSNLLGILMILVVLMGGSAGAAVYFTRRPPIDAAANPAANSPGNPTATANPTANSTGNATANPTANTAADPLPVIPDPTATHRPTTPSHPRHPTTAVTSPPTPPADPGYLTFDTYPWTRVSEGATALGTTPLVHTALPPGTHNLTVDNPEQGIHQTVTVTIKAGESLTKRLGLK